MVQAVGNAGARADLVPTAVTVGIGVTVVAGFGVAAGGWIDGANEVPSVVYLVLGMLTGAVFLTWLWRARLVAEGRGDRQRLARWWTFGAWFVPGANLVLPLLLMEDITGRSTALRVWWGLLLASGAVKLAGGALGDTISSVLVAAAGVLLVGVVRRFGRA